MFTSLGGVHVWRMSRCVRRRSCACVCLYCVHVGGVLRTLKGLSVIQGFVPSRDVVLG